MPDTTAFTDFTIHLADATDAGTEIHTGDGANRNELDRMLSEIQNMASLDVSRRLAGVKAFLQDKGCVRFNAMIMDQRVLESPTRPEWLNDHDTFTLLLDPRPQDAIAKLERAAEWGFRGIKYHPYMQDLDDSTFPAAQTVAAAAENLGLWVAIDCSYGTLKVFEQNGVRLLAAVAEMVKSTPVIALHGGGRLTLEAMSVAIAAPNVIMELSLSIPFWMGSSVEQDLAFAIRNIGVRRCMFSSDHPFIDLDTALAATQTFLEHNGFSDDDQEQIFLRTGEQLWNRL